MEVNLSEDWEEFKLEVVMGANNNQKFCWKTPKSHLSSSFLQPETEPKVNFSIDLPSNLFKIVFIDKILCFVENFQIKFKFPYILLIIRKNITEEI